MSVIGYIFAALVLAWFALMIVGPAQWLKRNWIWLCVAICYCVLAIACFIGLAGQPGEFPAPMPEPVLQSGIDVNTGAEEG